MAESKENMGIPSPSGDAYGDYLLEIANEADKRHFKAVVPGPIPGTMALSMDTDLTVYRVLRENGNLIAFTVPASTFLVSTRDGEPGSLPEHERGGVESPLYLYTTVVEMPKESELITESEIGEDGVEVTHVKGRKDGEQMQFTVKMLPIAPDDGTGPLTMLEAALWAGFKDKKLELMADGGPTEEIDVLFDEIIGLTAYLSKIDRWNQKAIKPEPPKQDTKKPTTHIQPISKVADKVTEVMSGEAVLLDVSGGNEAKRSVLTSLSLNYDGDDLELSRPMAAYDKEIHDAVATLYVAGNRTFTARQVYQTMTGVNSKPSKKKLEEIEASLDKQRRTFVTLDWSKELRGKTTEIDGETVTADQCHLETYMLNAKKLTIRTAKGNEVVGYSIAEPPVLYQHAITTRQLISYPQALLEATSAVASNTNTNMLMRSYLITRIKTMTRPGAKIAKQIRYDTVFEKAGAEPKERKDKARLVKTIKRYLDAFVKEGLIARWSEYEAKGSSHEKAGVTITTKRAR